MGSIGGSGMTNILSMVVGAVAGKVITSKLQDTVDTKILAVGQIAAGIFLPKVVKAKFMTGVGAGMIINGAMTGLQSFGVISAISGFVGADNSIDYQFSDTVSGGDELQTIAGNYMDEGTLTGADELQTLAGNDFSEEMYDGSF
tara:strand:+ start:648 stop:1079 length:432 start_codon:yes stop_codon:yes gene_type:complete